MSDKNRVLALLELGWTYRRIERETGVRRETIARYDPRRPAKAANLSASSARPHGPPRVAEAHRAQIEVGVQQGLSAQRIWQDLCEQVAYPYSYASVRRFVRRLKRRHPKLVDVLEHPPGEEGQVDFFQGPPTFDDAQGRWRSWLLALSPEGLSAPQGRA